MTIEPAAPRPVPGPNEPPAPGPDDRQPVVELVEVDKRLGGRPVLDRVSLQVGEGEFTGLIGSNGAGKTTLLRVILGLLEPDAGRVLVEGRAGGRRAGSIGYVPQKVDLDPDLPLRVRDLVALGVDGHRFGPAVRRRAARSERAGRVEEALDAVGATDLADRRVGRLSGGQQQRVMIAHALAGRPRLLLLDEPLANLDITATGEVVSVLASVCAARGVAVLISAHDMNPLLPVMDRIVYMAEGRVATGRTADVVRSDVLTDLYRSPVEVLEVHGRVLVVAGR